jgi:hypothetical protein
VLYFVCACFFDNAVGSMSMFALWDDYRACPHRKYKVKEGIGEYDDERCHLISFLNFHRLLGNPSAVVHAYKVCDLHQQVAGGRIRGVGGRTGFFGNS